MINEKQKEFLKDCNDLIESKKEETFESKIKQYYFIWSQEKGGFNRKDTWVGDYVKGFITFILKEEKQLHDTEIKELKDSELFKRFLEHERTHKQYVNVTDLQLKDLEFNLKIEKEAHQETAKDLTYQIKELQAEIEKLKKENKTVGQVLTDKRLFR
jgi:hypothetical protein